MIVKHSQFLPSSCLLMNKQATFLFKSNPSEPCLPEEMAQKTAGRAKKQALVVDNCGRKFTTQRHFLLCKDRIPCIHSPSEHFHLSIQLLDSTLYLKHG